MTHAAAAIAPQPDLSAGGRLVAADGRTLPLLGTRLTASAAGGLCRVLLEQRFRNPHAEPLRVTYLFPLPHDGAVSGFAFRLGQHRVVGEVDRVASARRRFEEALLEGRSAGLLEQVRGSVFTQELGNLPPGAEVVAEITVDQRLAWLPEGAWEWRFPTAVAPRYQGAEGRVPDAARLQVPVAEGGLPARLRLSLEVADRLPPGGALTSPAHPLRTDGHGPACRATLGAEEGVPLDRDVAIRWPAAAPTVGASLAAALAPQGGRLAGRAFGLVTLVPPRPGAVRALPRDLVVLLDTSGSMSGEPLRQAVGVVSALVESLGEADRLELLEFSDVPRRWKGRPVAATPRARREALAWLAGLEAGGSTEMGAALLEALRPLRAEAQRQVVLVTDGEIGFEDEILRTVIERLPAGSRLHAVAVGDAANRSLTGPAARAGRGVEVTIGLDEPAPAAAARLLARTVAPVVTEVEVTGDALAGVATARVPDLFAGAPTLVPVELAAAGGALTVRGRTADGWFEQTLEVAPPAAAPGGGPLAALYGREAVEEQELIAALDRDRDGADAAIERLGLAFQLATRRTAWVAVSDEATVDPRQPTRREVVPQELPHGMSVAGLGLRRAASLAMPMGGTVASVAWPTAAADLAFEAAASRELRRAAPSAPPPIKARARKEALREEVDEWAGPASSLPEGGGPEAPRLLPGRLVLATPDRLVIEVEVVGGPLDWDPTGPVLLDGLLLGGCAVDLDASTAAGRVAAGRTVRLVLRRDPTPGAAPLPARLGHLQVQPLLVITLAAAEGLGP